LVFIPAGIETIPFREIFTDYFEITIIKSREDSIQYFFRRNGILKAVAASPTSPNDNGRKTKLNTGLSATADRA
jgi:hypothetical protein